ncbi:HAD family hydrolase [Niallia circulans]|uniref:HAD family hydrolase n=1 Tax=Niallia circulans TaxID=1397 RepID=UPI00352FD56C
MKLFASDLDRTLIYSKRALEEMETPWNQSMIGVEEKNGKYVSYMTKVSYNLLKEIASRYLFIPVTTRTYEQYKRIFIFEREVPVSYCVTSNGARIHYNGEIMTEWEERLKGKLGVECSEKEEILEMLQAYSLPGDLKIADNLFFYYVFNTTIAADLKIELSKIAAKNGWNISLQGRKLYFMPSPVCKGEAIKYIKEREGIEQSIGAGDSLLDLPFLNICQTAFIPRHGELIGGGASRFSHKATSQKGAFAGEEIIRKVHKEFII